jgi:hypothetical protein
MTDPEPAHPAFSAYLRDTAYDEMFDAADTPPAEPCLICVHSWSRPAPPASNQGQQQQ